MLFRRNKRAREGLPPGPHFALTWEIPHNFGGLTKAMLQRSKALSVEADLPVTVMTFALQDNLEEVRSDLTARGFLGHGVLLRNMWEDLRDAPDELLRSASFDRGFTEPTADANAVRIERSDGTLLATQRWATVGDQPQLCHFGDYVLATALWAQDGSFIGGWAGSWGLWLFWIGQLMPDSDCCAIVDSSVIADLMAQQSSTSATTMYMFHSNHLLRRRTPPYAPLSRWRRYVSEHHNDFDGVVFLTEAQRRDFGRLLGDTGNSHTITNVIQTPIMPGGIRRDPLCAVVVSRYSSQKRLSHALRAVTRASRSNPGLHLDLFGAGPNEQELRDLAHELHAPATFHGYTDLPTEEFARASFSLLTSTHEGLGLTVIESMAAGCVPLAYDVPYGPSDTITNGVDGFLVPAGDHLAMAKQISEFLALDARTVGKMRNAGRKRAQDFAKASIISSWGDALRTAQDRRTGKLRPPLQAGLLAREEFRAASIRFASAATVAELVCATWHGRDGLSMEIRVHPEGPSRTPVDGVTASLIDVSTGISTSLPVEVLRGRTDASDPPQSVYISLNIDLTDIGAPLDHTVMLGLESDPSPVRDVIRGRRGDTPWVAFAAATSCRPVLLLDPNRGLLVTTAAPKITASVSTDGNDVTMCLEALIDGTIDRARAVGLNGALDVDAYATSTGEFNFRLPDDGLWEVHAWVSGKSRLVAYQASSEQLNTQAADNRTGVHIGATARGYLRLSVLDQGRTTVARSML